MCSYDDLSTTLSDRKWLTSLTCEDVFPKQTGEVWLQSNRLTTLSNAYKTAALYTNPPGNLQSLSKQLIWSLVIFSLYYLRKIYVVNRKLFCKEIFGSVILNQISDTI